MTDTTLENNEMPAAEVPEAAPAKPKKKEDSFPVFVLKLAIAVVLFRSGRGR